MKADPNFFTVRCLQSCLLLVGKENAFTFGPERINFLEKFEGKKPFPDKSKPSPNSFLIHRQMVLINRLKLFCKFNFHDLWSFPIRFLSSWEVVPSVIQEENMPLESCP